MAASTCVRGARRRRRRPAGGPGHPRPGPARGRPRPFGSSPGSSTASPSTICASREQEVKAALAAIPTELRAALEVAHDNIVAYHRTQLHPDGRHQPRRGRRPGSGRPGGPGRSVRPGRASPSGLHRAHDRRAGPGRRRGRAGHVLAARARRPPGLRRSWPRPPSPASTRCTASAGPRPSPPWPTGPRRVPAVDVIVGPGNRYVAIAERLVAGEGVVGVPSAFAGPVRGRRGRRRRRRPSTYAAVDLVVQAEHGPDGLAYLITWSEAAAAAIERPRSPASPRPRPGAPRSWPPCSAAATPCWSTGPSRPWRSANAVAAEHLELLNDDPDIARPAHPQRRRGVPRPVGPRQRRRLRRRPQPRAAHRPVGPLRERPAGRRLPQAHPRGRPSTGRRWRGWRRTWWPWPTSEGLPAHADSVRIRRAGRDSHDGPARPPGGPGLAGGLPLPAGRRRGPAQHQRVAAAAPARLARGAAAEELDAIPWNRYPDRAATALRAALADLHGVRSDQIFCANGSNEVLQSLCLAYGGPGRSVAVFEPTYALHSHIAHLTGTAVVEGQRPARLFPGSGPGARRCWQGAQPGHHLPLLAQQPDRAGRRPVDRAGRARRLAPGLVVVDEAYGQFADWSALSLVDDEVPLVVTRTFSKTWSMAAARLGYLVGPGAGGRRPGAGGPPVPPRRLEAGRRPAGRPLRRGNGGAGGARSSASGSGSWRLWAGCR